LHEMKLQNGFSDKELRSNHFASFGINPTPSYMMLLVQT
jgi:hypothetical protein